MRTLVKVVNGHGGFDIAIPDNFAAMGEDGQSKVEELHAGNQLEISCEMGMLSRVKMTVFMHCWQIEGVNTVSSIWSLYMKLPPNQWPNMCDTTLLERFNS